MNHPTCGGGGGPSGGPKEQQLYHAAYTASSYSIDDAQTQIEAAKKNLDVVTAQLDKLVPLLAEAWTSSDGQAAVSSTKDLSATLSQKAQQLQDSSQALQTAKKAVDVAQTYWSNHQPPPTAPTAPDYFDFGSSTRLRDRGRPVQHRQEDLRRHGRQPRGGDGDAVHPAAEAAGQRRNRSGQGELDRGVGRPARGRLRHRRFRRRPARHVGRWPAALDRRTRPADGRRTRPAPRPDRRRPGLPELAAAPASAASASATSAAASAASAPAASSASAASVAADRRRWRAGAVDPDALGGRDPRGR